ncbi:hypothetical protein JFL43_20485 [Viridibacillus sp. YIM B01967]|uniref:Uncharacterized protein n=1 Tax=Viridibacillus soli TaxID=2798301 RepID=A0ABS1HCN1_9BACL|nr:hypothetical protein [Viridibacillus soli]MBK3497164.1 hypothetical protein [Viridibacillus soli]
MDKTEHKHSSIMSDGKSKLVKDIVLNTNDYVVGDHVSDIKGAKDNRLFAIGCQCDFAQPSELEQADFVIK